MIGKIEKVALSEIWKQEAQDFTTWLENNMDVLNAALNFQLVSIDPEKKTGNFNVDLVAKDDNGNIVVIENLLEKSNHDRLSKVKTYHAAVGASKAIWIVAEPRQEHIKAVLRLNNSTTTECYLFKLEGLRIGNSDPAPLFTLIVGPSEEVRDAGQTKKEHAKRLHLKKEFWALLFEKVKLRTKLHANLSPSTHNWIGTGAGTSGLKFNYVIGQHDAKVELYIDQDNDTGAGNKKIFEQLFKEKNLIEEVFQGELNWERLDNKRACRIAKQFNQVGYMDKDDWESLCDSMIHAMINLEKAFTPFIHKLRK